MAILLSKNIAQCDDRARPRDVTTARRSVGLGLVEILSWMRHWFSALSQFTQVYKICAWIQAAVGYMWTIDLCTVLAKWLNTLQNNQVGIGGIIMFAKGLHCKINRYTLLCKDLPSFFIMVTLYYITSSFLLKFFILIHIVGVHSKVSITKSWYVSTSYFLTQENYALKYKMGVAAPRLEGPKRLSEYQKAFAWKKGDMASPLLAAEQVCI